MTYPSRIVCLTEEPTEVLYALGEERRIVGISGFTVRPARARKEKPKVSAFISAKIGEILKLEPDLVIGFSDIQADIARDLIKAGVEVWISNHRSVTGILGYIRRLGAMVGASDKAEVYAREAEAHIAAVTAKAGGLRTDRRISHVFVMDVPAYAETIFVTDAAINIFPDLDAKRDIIQNAIDLYVEAGFGKSPRVAILSAVETVTSKIPSTIEAAALCKMADRGQITGGILDGPLAFDNAIDVEAARIKGIKSEVAGRAQILVVPDLEAGNMLAKNLAYFAKADGAGIVLGARVPVVLTSRADSARARMASCAVAALYAHARRRRAPTIAA
jgi:hypothetical protein